MSYYTTYVNAVNPDNPLEIAQYLFMHNGAAALRELGTHHALAEGRVTLALRLWLHYIFAERYGTINKTEHRIVKRLLRDVPNLPLRDAVKTCPFSSSSWHKALIIAGGTSCSTCLGTGQYNTYEYTGTKP